ncbi:MAG: hypothetical protein PF590_01870 [Candidatus Delongbacteria bacterium]|jgi:hypothetical protein|nr:hypothetical protein [Candidatus Delongbacteria bacterium]
MKRNKLLFIFAAMVMAISGFSQDYNEKLLVKYSGEEIQNLKAENPNEFEFLNYFVENGFRIIDMPDKPIDHKELIKIENESKQISSSDLVGFNPLEYKDCIYGSERQYFKAGNTGKLIIIPKASQLRNQIENMKRIEKQ